MGTFDFFHAPNINTGVNEFHATPKGVLLDVRTPQEFREGHIPGSQNVPLQAIDKVGQTVENKDTPLFVYCHSGARSRQAAALLKQMGYSKVKNIGGLAAYFGKVEY